VHRLLPANLYFCAAEHDPEKHFPDVIREGHWFSEKIMLHQKVAEDS